MNTIQENKLSTYLALKAICDRNISTWQSLKRSPTPIRISGHVSRRSRPSGRTRPLIQRAYLRTKSNFEKQWRSLALLTRHLPQLSRLPDECPKFHSQVIAHEYALSGKLADCMRQSLADLREHTAMLDPMKIWGEHLHTLVPSPDQTGSYYREPAAWMRALYEINTESYERLLARWKVEFRRRRNLRAEMTAAHCPGV